ncbi:hypothetical protein [Flavobacterium chryseum]|nr:hypothetical protein [Flavobacterium sp. P3160]
MKQTLNYLAASKNKLGLLILEKTASNTKE